jgi:catalase
MISPDEVTDRLHQILGRHDGHRPVHAKGSICRGTFTATPAAASLCRAIHLQGQPVDATVRFSNASADPDAPDYLPDSRGLAVKLHLPDGGQTDIVAAVLSRITTTDVAEVLEFIRAGRPGYGMVPRMLWYLARRPRLLPTNLKNLAATRPPSSYAACSYYALHAFRWIDPEGVGRYVRYTFLPESPEGPLSRREARRRGPDYLQEDLRERLASGPIRFVLQVQVAADGDVVDDPTCVWPADRSTIDVGHLQLAVLETSAGPDGNRISFDPTTVTDGIELSNDPILRFRSSAYWHSVKRRTNP